MITKIDKKGIDFITKEEGVVLHPYLDQIGVPTIGIGSTMYEGGIKVTMRDKPITLARAQQLFSNILLKYENTVRSTIKKDITQNQFNALVSLCYNIGQGGFSSSTVAKKVNINPNDITIGEAFKLWNKAGGKVNPTLVGRRIREAQLYYTK